MVFLLLLLLLACAQILLFLVQGEAKGRIDFDSETVVRLSSTKLQVVAQGKIYHFMADSEQDGKSWLEALTKNLPEVFPSSFSSSCFKKGA